MFSAIVANTHSHVPFVFIKTTSAIIKTLSEYPVADVIKNVKEKYAFPLLAGPVKATPSAGVCVTAPETEGVENG